MGTFFSNFHIRKTEHLQPDDIQGAVIDWMGQKGYQLVTEEQQADGMLVMFMPQESRWVSVCTDLLDLMNPFAASDCLAPFARTLQTDILFTMCIDSDSLILHMIDSTGDANAWAAVGDMEYFPPDFGSDLSAWETKVTDMEQFRACIQQQYVFAEEAMHDLQGVLEMSGEQGCLMLEDAEQSNMQEHIAIFYFAAAVDETTSEPPQFDNHLAGTFPCVPGKERREFVYNKGGASQGIAIAFTGGDVEHDEITFSDVKLEYFVPGKDGRERRSIPMTLEKCRQSDGKWMYYWENPEFSIPPGANPALPLSRRDDIINERIFGVCFTPNGNKRKFLDITVHFIPTANWNGQCSWYVWKFDGSKETYVQRHSQPSGMPGLAISPEDYDL